jgi:hypothetical protein
MKNLFISFFASCALGVSALMMSTALHTPLAFSQSAEEFGVVINLSGKQRMLTQKMSKEVMLIALDENKSENLKNLKATAALFDKTLTGLRAGDSDLKLPATESERILRQLGRVDKLWAEFYPVVQSITGKGSVDDAEVSTIAAKNLPLLKQMNKAVGAYEREATKGGMKADPGLATTLNLSGKQRMLTQKMSKEFFLVATNHEVADNRLNLLETFTLFERTLTGLKVGDDTLGLPPTEDTSILDQLDKVIALWTEAKPTFVSASQGSDISGADVQKIAKLNLPLLKEMNKAVGMYEALAK